MKRLLFSLLLLPLLLSCSEQVVLDNGALRLTFDRASGKLVSLQNVERGYEYLDTEAEALPLYELVAMEEGQTLEEPQGVCVCRAGLRTVKLVWGTESKTKITATVRLDKQKAMSYWSVEMQGHDGEKTRLLRFPRISNIKAFDEERVAMTNWTGILYHNPRATRKEIAMEINVGRPTMQFSSIYGVNDGHGLYFGSNDTQAYSKGTRYAFRDNVTDYNFTHLLEMGPQNSSYCAPFEVLVGVVEGDWYDATQIYREWALQQEWVKNCRLHSGKMNPWMPDTDVWVWNRGRSNNVLTEAADLKEYLGDCNVSVLWHWWHNGPYDDAFPEFLPPREGEESFKAAVAEAKAKGINMTPYMNSIQWGESRETWKTLNIPQYSARRHTGKTYAHVYNIFTGNAITPMCMTQEFWRDTYSSLAHAVVNDYGCTGVYMDQACLNYPCYNANHGHSVGGGNYWVNGYRRLVERVREATAPVNTVLTGEGSGEDLMEYLDGFLCLEASYERSGGVKDFERLPMFQAVYHEYAISYGNFGGFTYPPYDEFWPKKYRSPLTEMLLPATYDKQMRMEQTRTFVWGLQPMLVNYHAFARKARPAQMSFLADLIKTRKAHKDYLQYGRMLRAPKFADDAPCEMDMARMSTYGAALGTGQTLFPFKKVVPMLYSAAWQNKEGSVLLTFVNIDEKAHSTSFVVDLEEMGLTAEHKLYIDGVAQEGAPLSQYEIALPACSVAVYEFRK